LFVLFSDLLRVEHDVDRAVILDVYVHVRAEFTGADRVDGLLSDLLDEIFVETLGITGGSGVTEVRTASVLHVGAQSDIGNDQNIAADIVQRAVHLTVIILKNAQLADLLREKIRLCFGVALHCADEHHETGADLSCLRIVDRDHSAVRALNNCSHNSFHPLYLMKAL